MTEKLEDRFRVCEVDDGRFFAGHIFARKLGGELPEEKRHLVAFYRKSALAFVPLGYLHVLEAFGQGLIGGACVDGSAFEAVAEPDRTAIRERGGVLHAMLSRARDAMADDYEAFFAYTGNPRAAEVNLQVGYERTENDRLFALFHRPIPEARRNELIRRCIEFGPF
ncbi:MAG: hypothetical protein ACNS61_13875 [Candidatus Wenzhouxiangella sp. M2_3B_020]